MNHLLKLPVLIVLISSCHKEDSNKEKKPAIECLKTTLMNTGISEGLESIFFLTENDGFITGAAGGIYKTTNGAKTWTALNSTVQLPIDDIYFLDASKGFAAGGENSCGGTGCVPAGGFILATSNGGQTWKKIFTPSEKVEISSVYFINADIGFCAGDNVIFKTSNGGQSWSEYKITGLGGKMMKIVFTDPENGYVICLFDKIIKTTNGGLTWQVTTPNTNTGYYSLSSSGGSIYVSGQGKIIKSVNGGNAWMTLANSPTDIFALYFIDKNTGFAFGRGNYSGGDFGYFYGAVYCTGDGGNTWNGTSDIREIGPIREVSFPSKNIGYAISGNEVIKLSAN